MMLKLFAFVASLTMENSGERLQKCSQNSSNADLEKNLLRYGEETTEAPPGLSFPTALANAPMYESHVQP